ncbi:hypothetical protein GY45DRAFT_1363252 [Cubamyces sp. BRFM 1775]|nr:hypothetical protein GY45DRAFT_1363252 [Cubamyces sp. BRFM 1775]
MTAESANRAHHVWAIAEVVREIMKQNAFDPETLAHCARASRVLSDPALEVLWEYQTGLERVLGLLPSSFRKVSAGHEDFLLGTSRQCFVLYDAIRDEEWARMLRYTCLVRSFRSGGERVDGLATAVLFERLNGQPLFPKLRRLTWKSSTEGSAILPLFFSPMLSCVSLDLLSDEERFDHQTSAIPTAVDYAYRTALAILYSRAPNVKDIGLSTSGFHCSVERIANFHRLHSLNLGPVRDPGPILELCGSLPHLTHLTLDIANHSGTNPTPPQLPETFLGPLKQLFLSGPPKTAVLFLEAVKAPSLSLLDIRFEVAADLWKHCLEVIPARFGASLRHFTAGVEDGIDDGEKFSFHDWFSPLYAIRDLRRVHVDSLYDTSFKIVAQDLDNIASAWPKLRSLSLPHSLEDDRSSAFPITALQPLAAKCPHLRTLIIPLPQHAPLAGSTLPPVSVHQTSLEEICLPLGQWPPDMRERCITYLTSLFPRAETVLLDEEFGDMDDDQ